MLADRHTTLGSFEDLREHGGTNLGSGFTAKLFIRFVCCFDRGDDFLNGFDAKVCGIQEFFKFLERRWVKFGAAEDSFEGFVESRGLLFKTLFELTKEAAHTSANN
jgi:hypothetical protein